MSIKQLIRFDDQLGKMGVKESDIKEYCNMPKDAKLAGSIGGGLGGSAGAAIFEYMYRRHYASLNEQISKPEEFGLTTGKFLSPIAGAWAGSAAAASWAGFQSVSMLGPIKFQLVSGLAGLGTGLVVGMAVQGVAVTIGWTVSEVQKTRQIAEEVKKRSRELENRLSQEDSAFRRRLNNINHDLDSIEKLLKNTETM